MVNYFNVQTIQACLDEYMIRMGKTKIDEIEANHELERAGLMADDAEYPGEPLREFLGQLRDTNSLPKTSLCLIRSGPSDTREQMRSRC